MPQTGGKLKVSKTPKKKKTSLTSKRNFTVVIGSKEHGLYVSSSPSSAARKAVSKLCASNKSKKVQFHIREITQKSEKKTYGPYLGYIEKLAKPIELKGRVIRYKPVAKLMKKTGKKSVVKKGGMRGGEIGDNGENLDESDFLFEKILGTNDDPTGSEISATYQIINIKKSSFLKEPYIFFGVPFINHKYTQRLRGEANFYWYLNYVIFKTFPKKEVKIFKLYPDNPEHEKVRELKELEIKNEEFKAVLRELKNDIDSYRRHHTPRNVSFCSTIYNYIGGILSENS
jgi:hypothetical protein